MTTLTHSVLPEDIMAWIDGELSAAEADSVSQHIERCAECSALCDQLRNTSRALSDWPVPPVPETLDQMIETRLASMARNSKTPRLKSGFTIRNWRMWAVGGGGVVLGALALMVFSASTPRYASVPRHVELVAPKQQSLMALSQNQPASQVLSQQEIVAEYALDANVSKGKLPAPPPPPAVPPAPLIARTASLTILVKDLNAARSSMDAVLARHHGYSAELTILDETPPRGLQGSLRIPASELESALSELRAFGKVQRESESGQEVTQQHVDLAARLANARETETRLRDILANRTGKMQDVLDVEDKISETRGEIEQLEAEQTNLEHRVEFASVDLELVEQYKDNLSSPTPSISNQMRNSSVAGLRHAGKSLLGLMLFLEEFGPVVLLWLVLLGVPAILLWRRYIKIRSAIG